MNECEYQTVKTQVASFEALGFLTRFDVTYLGSARVLLLRDIKSYRFSDPDWNVVISQLSKLYRLVVDSGGNT